ncbi:hypothetical protein DSL62_19120 [Pantoea sp. 3_1284]|nr:hypothetical protein DSL62_19120 [Pantoea sp. 3_1284]
MLTQLRLHWKDRFGYCAPLKPVTTVQRVGSSKNLEKPPLVAVVFSFQCEDTSQPSNRQEAKACNENSILECWNKK